MKKYHYTDGITSFGPFTLEELSERNITKETKVWFQGLGEWKPAGEIPELAGILKLAPPPITRAASHNANAQPPKTWLVESILVTIFCFLPLGIVGIIYALRVESKFYAGDIEGANRAAADAKKWTKIGFYIGIIVAIIYLITLVVSTVLIVTRGEDILHQSIDF